MFGTIGVETLKRFVMNQCLTGNILILRDDLIFNVIAGRVLIIHNLTFLQLLLSLKGGCTHSRARCLCESKRSDQFGPFHTRVIAATANEAPHVLDGLLYHKSSLVINEYYTDTGGFSDHVFAIATCSAFVLRRASAI
jgi:hypothetical protein